MSKKDQVKDLGFTIPAKTIMPKYNSYQTGYGYYDQHDKRSDFKAETRDLIEEYENEMDDLDF